MRELEGLPESKLHCAKLAVITLQKTIAKYEKEALLIGGIYDLIMLNRLSR